jgi:hypothetical protein
MAKIGAIMGWATRQLSAQREPRLASQANLSKALRRGGLSPQIGHRPSWITGNVRERSEHQPDRLVLALGATRCPAWPWLAYRSKPRRVLLSHSQLLSMTVMCEEAAWLRSPITALASLTVA